LKVYKKIAGKKPMLFLNGVSSYVMEDMIGEIPRKRAWLRRVIKQLLTQGFKPSGAF
jgi:GH35 family endo-1,4-beta-xylanase